MGTAPLRVGLVGANWGLTHVAAWRRVPGVEIAAICTSRRETAQAVAVDLGIDKACWDAAAFVEDAGLDIIDVTPRPSIRAPIVAAALAAGKHVLQPLPFGLDLAGGRSLVSAATGSGRVALVESLHRHAPVFRQAKALIEAGFVGEAHTVHGHVRTGILLNPPPNYVYGWITDPANGASALRNFGAHLLHTLTWLAAPIVGLDARIETRLPQIRFSDGSTAANGTSDSAQLLVDFQGGATGTVDVSWCAPGGEGFRLDLMGPAGRLVITADGLGPQNARLQGARRGEPALAPIAIEDRFRRLPEIGLYDADLADPRAFALTAMCHRMAQAVRSGAAGDAGPDFTEAFAVMQVVEAAYAAAEESAWVDLAEFDAQTSGRAQRRPTGSR